eukprot:3077844-Pleurochrysis_carterae.AAC.2
MDSVLKLGPRVAPRCYKWTTKWHERVSPRATRAAAWASRPTERDRTRACAAWVQRVVPKRSKYKKQHAEYEPCNCVLRNIIRNDHSNHLSDHLKCDR